MVKLAKQHSGDLSNVKSQISSYSTTLDNLRQDLESISVEPGQDGGNHRIFNYLEKDEDKKKFSGLIAEAITKEMTYAEIDDFLSKSLPKEIDVIIKDHPSLTKQYIRDCKNS